MTIFQLDVMKMSIPLHIKPPGGLFFQSTFEKMKKINLKK
jgi:hypothetical protein